MQVSRELEPVRNGYQIQIWAVRSAMLAEGTVFKQKFITIATNLPGLVCLLNSRPFSRDVTQTPDH